MLDDRNFPPKPVCFPCEVQLGSGTSCISQGVPTEVVFRCRAVNSTPSSLPKLTPRLTGHTLDTPAHPEKRAESAREKKSGDVSAEQPAWGELPSRGGEAWGAYIYLSAQFPRPSAPPSVFFSVCEEP